MLQHLGGVCLLDLLHTYQAGRGQRQVSKLIGTSLPADKEVHESQLPVICSRPHHRKERSTTSIIIIDGILNVRREQGIYVYICVEKETQRNQSTPANKVPPLITSCLCVGIQEEGENFWYASL